MAVYKNIFSDIKQQRGASMLEVMLSMAIVAIAAPFIYGQISKSTNVIRDMAMANTIISLKNPVFNFIRLNQDQWPETVQIRLADEELDTISELPTAGFIDKYLVQGAVITDIYLGFDFGETDLRAAQIARTIGIDAAVVGQDGIAYGQGWAVSAPDFKPGNLVYKISRDLSGEDKSKYLHRGTSGEDELNKMLRNLNMGNNNIYNIGGITAKSVKSSNGTVFFTETQALTATNMYFSAGANVDGDKVYFKNMRVSDDVTGFRNIYADSLNGNKYTTKGSIVADRATIVNSVNVSNNFVIKSDSLRSVSGFTGIKANSAYIPYLSTQEIVFYENFGLTISGELLMSTNSPLKVGNWYFPSIKPPEFRELNIERSKIPPVPDNDMFKVIMGSGWQSAEPKIQI